MGKLPRWFVGKRVAPDGEGGAARVARRGGRAAGAAGHLRGRGGTDLERDRSEAEAAWEPARLRFLRRDPRAALTIDRYSDDWEELAWVQVLGRVAIIEVEEGRRAWKRSGRSTPSTARWCLQVPCLLWIRSDIFGGELRIRRSEAGVAATATGDQDLVAGGGALHPVAELLAELGGRRRPLRHRLRESGASGTRTPDLSAASRTLSQLSYSPKSVFVRKCYRRPAARSLAR